MKVLGDITKLKLEIIECHNNAGWIGVEIKLLNKIIDEREKMMGAILSVLKVLPPCEAGFNDNCPHCALSNYVKGEYNP